LITKPLCKQSPGVLGRRDVAVGYPPLGPAGAVTPVSSPRDTADALGVLLTDPQRREACGRAIQDRVRRYYNKVDIDRTYGDLYRSLAGRKDDETLMLEAV